MATRLTAEGAPEGGLPPSWKFPANLPITLEFLGQAYGACLREVSRNGATIESAAPLMEEDVVAVGFGAMGKAATVVWKDGTRIGLHFADGMPEEEIVATLRSADPRSRWMKMASAILNANGN